MSVKGATGRQPSVWDACPPGRDRADPPTHPTRLRGNARVVGARQPQRGAATHALVASHDVLCSKRSSTRV